MILTEARSVEAARLDLERAVDRNAVVFERLVAVARRRLAQGRLASVMGWARAAALFAAWNPPGPLRSVELEAMLDEVSRRALPPVVARIPTRGRRHVLHVLSEAPDIGGHVRMATRWSEVDTESTASFVMTRPDYITPDVHEAAARTGGEVHVLDHRSLVERACALRTLSAGADFVVCHTHPDDPVPSVAFGGDYDGAPVILVNHADHVFFLGPGNVSLIANLRMPIAHEVTVGARGYPVDNSGYLPIPLPEPIAAISRPAAKETIGIDPGTTVALTLARAQKFLPSPLFPTFMEVVEPALAACERTTLVAVGPTPDYPGWVGATDRLGERLVLPGPQPRPDAYLAAADLYLDAFPHSSTTSQLEAATHGLPVLRFQPYRGLSMLLGGGGVLDGAAICAPDVDSFRDWMLRLSRDPALRAEHGEKARAIVYGHHLPRAWYGELQRIYATAAAAPPSTVRAQPTGYTDAELRAYAVELLGLSLSSSLIPIVGWTTPVFDGRDRAAVRARSFFVRGRNRVLRAFGRPKREYPLILLPRR